MRIHSRTSANGAGRILGVTLLAVSLILAFSMTPALAQNSRSIKVMQQNMDSGTDLGFVFGAPSIEIGAQLTYQEITTSSMIPERARRLADEIAAAKPDIISLQEVTTWAVVSAAGTQVLYNQLELLMEALEARNEHYEVAGIQPLTAAQAPLDNPPTQALAFMDSNAILVRSDTKHAGLTVSPPVMNNFTNLFSFGGITEVLGWMYVDIDFNGNKARYFNTHLESTSALIPERGQIQVLQGDELIVKLNDSTLPVILAGDFNSDASPLGIGPDLTPTAGNIADEGYVEVWGALHRSEQGLTWPRYLEDVYPIPTSQVLTAPTERIDLIFEKGLTPINIELTRRMNPPLASDHVGVIATLRFSK